MPSWSDLLDVFSMIDVANRGDYLAEQTRLCTERIAHHCDRNVLYYASSFLQKPQVPGQFMAINMEDINGFMAGIHGHDFSKGLLLILHTPGGMAEAAQTLVDYLRSKFSEIDVLIPTYAMSAGTMIALGCDRIIMGRQSQLGPTDPQLIIGDQAFSAHSIVEQFEEAKQDIAGNPVLAHAWAPVLRSLGPAVVQEARKSIVYGEELVKDWLQAYMFSQEPDPQGLATAVAGHFGGSQHGRHGRRINRDEARQHHLKIIDLEDDQTLQEEVLTLYHHSTIAFNMGPAVKSVSSSNGQLWVKSLDMETSDQPPKV
ncbi:MAG: hypothetical protein OXC53_04315 [Rhodobacteraceae bacterium]|nr:hypothetical protein [Paracoccaceae bacterium]